jgi:DNA polymerase-3 subunit gamma/tau
MYVVFARKYRPQRLEEVVGQQHVARTLRNAVTTGRVAHAYLFCGSRGVGKTTVARILAKALNCAEGPTPEPCCRCSSCLRIAAGDDLDVMEIDGASNRGIDEVRELRQNVRLAPSHSRFKIYYIDEVHMLTEPAFNAILKTLEEPPAHVKFIFSTTDPQKMPETVKSRCQRFDFRRIADADIVAALGRICAAEGLEVEEGGLAAVARSARGSLRDALGVLDQLASLGQNVSLADVLAVLGAVDGRALGEIVDALAAEDAAAALGAVDRLLFEGTDVEVLADQLSQYLRDLLVATYCGPDDGLLAGSCANTDDLRRQSGSFSPDQLTYMIQVLREAKLRARRETIGRLALELAIIKLSRLSELVPLEQALGSIASGPTAAAGANTSPPAANAIRNMRNRLRNHVRGNPAVAASRRVPVPNDKPEGISDVTYRKLMTCAENPEVGRQALTRDGFVKAFVEADGVLGLEPVRLERYSAPAQADEELEPSDEDAEEEAQ